MLLAQIALELVVRGFLTEHLKISCGYLWKVFDLHRSKHLFRTRMILWVLQWRQMHIRSDGYTQDAAKVVEL